MKKTKIIRAAAILMLLAMAATAFVGCKKSDAKLIVGKWQTTVNIEKALGDELQEMTDELGSIDLSDITLTVNIEFKEDGTYTAGIDKASGQEAVDKMFAAMTPVITNMFKTQLAGELDMDPSEITDEMLNELLAQAGMPYTSIQGFIDYLKSDVDTDEMFNEAASEGKYILKDGKIYMSDSLEEEATENSDATKYEFTDATNLKLEPDNPDDVPEGMKDLLPLTFKKVG